MKNNGFDDLKQNRKNKQRKKLTNGSFGLIFAEIDVKNFFFHIRKKILSSPPIKQFDSP